jgi:predicted RNA-binding protein YlqC (UPF0109 family)
MTQQIQQLVYEMAQALVDAPQAVQVQTVEREDGILFRLRVAQPDIGKIIGKQGRTARSLRTILAAAGAKRQMRLSLDILDEDEK